MKFITAEQFSKADKKVRDSIMEWWEPGVGDLVQDINYLNCTYEVEHVDKVRTEDDDYSIITDCSLYYSKGLLIPLLTVGQLIEFIEWKTDSMVDIVRDYEVKDKERTVVQCYSRDMKTLENGVTDFIEEYEVWGHDILNALWEVAQKVCE